MPEPRSIVTCPSEHELFVTIFTASRVKREHLVLFFFPDPLYHVE